MPGTVSDSRPPPDITSLVNSRQSSTRHHHVRSADVFPPSYRLIVTTTKGVYAWDMNGVTELFRSGSQGIVAARRLSGDSELLAVADSQVVVLHDVNKGMQRSYRLKGSEGQVRLLKYAGDSSKNLFFTTTLRNSVQTYSLKHSKVLDPSDSHPSPPSVFALSCTSHLLLSTSASPPTIHLRNLSLNISPILLRPRCSSSAVVAADFHPEDANTFLLAFADGSAAVYDASLMFRNKGGGERIERPAGSGTGGEIGNIIELHAIGSGIPNRTSEAHYRGDPDGNGIQAGVSGITSVALVPGHRALAVTVGADGKCCVVDFTQPTREKAVLLKSWHLRRPATSLSVVYSKLGAQSSRLDGADENEAPSNKDYCIAVGRQDGKVLLFDLDGKPLGKQVLDPKGARVVDVEWAKKEIDAAFERTRSSTPSQKKSTPMRKSLGTEVIKKGPVTEDEPTVSHRESMELARDSLFDFSSPHLRRPRAKAVNHLDLPHAVGPKVRNLVATPAAADGRPDDLGSSSSSFMPTSDSTSLIVEFGNSPPPIPPRPTPKPGGKLSERRSMTTTRERGSNTSDLSILASAHRKTANDLTPTKLPVPASSPSNARNLLGPHSPPRSQTKSWIQCQRSKVNYVSPRVHNEPPRGFEFASQPGREPPPELESARHNEAPIGLDFTNPKPQSPLKPLEAPTVRSSTASLRSYKTASSRVDVSETSTDTVVDWSTAASSRRPAPSLREPSPVHAAAPQPFFLRDRPVENAPKNEPRGQKGKTKKKGHESIPESARTSHSTGSSLSQLSQDTATQDAIIHWPSMKKSPRIADISAGIVSATASVLEVGGYADSSSPEKINDANHTSPGEPERKASTSSKKDRFIPPRLPLKISPSTTILPHNIAHTCPCEPHLQESVKNSLDTIRAVEQGFKAQRTWFEEVLKGRDESRVRLLEEENRRLRADLAR